MEEQGSYDWVSSGLLSCTASGPVRGLSSAQGHEGPLRPRPGAPRPGLAERGGLRAGSRPGCRTLTLTLPHLYRS